jgi:hypothetical protein
MTSIVRHGRRIEVETLTNTAAKQVTGQKREPFVQVPLALAARAAAATNNQKMMVWLWLRHQAWKTRRKVVAAPNGVLTEYGISPDVKRAALRQLEAAGLIGIERRPRKTPIVTIL